MTEATVNGKGLGRHSSAVAIVSVAIASALVSALVVWGITQEQLKNNTQRIEKIEQTNTSERLAIIETKIDMIANGLGIRMTPLPRQGQR